MPASDVATPISAVQARTRVRVTGTVAALTRSPPMDAPRLTITVTDDTSSLHAVFMGRRNVPGIVVGRSIALTGRFTVDDGELLALNPEYELLK